MSESEDGTYLVETPQEKKYGKGEYAIHSILMILPNIFNPSKLRDNVTHPIREWAHSSHLQYPIDYSNYYVVEHYVGDRLVTADLVEKADSILTGLSRRLMRLFEFEFYYGHEDYFPQEFQLIERLYVDSNRELHEYLQKMWIY